MSSFLVTGATRGFGLALVRELLSRPASEVSRVFATSRGPSSALDELVKQAQHRLTTITLDITNEKSVEQAAFEVEVELKGNGLDVLINNAGVAQVAADGVKSMDNLQESILINVMGAHWVTRAFLPLLQKGQLKKVANVSTTLGSIALAPSYQYFPGPAYKISKAALNALTVQYALDHGKAGFSFMAVSPGWMKTELGGGEMADLTPEIAAKAFLDVVYRPNQETNGKFGNVFVEGYQNAEGPNRYDGKDSPW